MKQLIIALTAVGLACVPLSAYSQEINQISGLETKLVSTATNSSAYLQLMPTGQINKFGNPIYQLRLYFNGQIVRAYQAVTGRYYSQNRNRHVAGTKAPLPDGRYSLARYPVVGTTYEVGGTFLPITPLFRTGRSALGIHYDPSFERNQKEDGTDGCIALTSPGARDAVFNFIKNYQPQFLVVTIGR